MTVANYTLNTEATPIVVNLPQIVRANWAGKAQVWDDKFGGEKAVYNLNASNKNYPASLVLTQKVEKTSGKLRTAIDLNTMCVTQITETGEVLFSSDASFGFYMRTPGNGLFDVTRAQIAIANLFSCMFVTAPSGDMDLTVLNKWASGILTIA